jgi:hypothetical protein
MSKYRAASATGKAGIYATKRNAPICISKKGKATGRKPPKRPQKQMLQAAEEGAVYRDNMISFNYYFT